MTEGIEVFFLKKKKKVSVLVIPSCCIEIVPGHIWPIGPSLGYFNLVNNVH